MSEKTLAVPPILHGQVDTSGTLEQYVPSRDRAEFAKAQFVASAFMPDVMQQLSFFSNIIIIILGWLSVSLEVFIRYNFGERYLSIIRLSLAFVAMCLIAFGSIGLNSLNNSLQGSVIYVLFLLAFGAVSILHRIYIWYRNNMKKQAWHSMSFGVSWFAKLGIQQRLRINDWILYAYIEPFLCLIGAALIFYIDATTGVWLTLSSIALLFKNQMVYATARDRILDMVDAQLEMEHLQSSLRGAPKTMTGGFVAVPVSGALREEIRGIAPDIAETLDDVMGEKEIQAASEKSATKAEPELATTLDDILGNPPSPSNENKDETVNSNSG